MRRGFTILEVLVASSILAIGSLGVLGMLITTIENNRASRLRTDAVIIAEQQLADMEAISLMGNPNGTNARDDLFREIQDTDPGSSWQHWQNVDAHGVHQNIDTNNLYSIGFIRLPADTNIAPRNTFIRGAIRVTWSKTGSWDNKCANVFSSLDNIQSRQQGNAQNCDFVTLPFAFRTTSNI